MCVPDLLGTQGTFLLFTTRPAQRRASRRAASACRSTVAGRPHRHGVSQGPENAFRRRRIRRSRRRSRIVLDRAGRRVDARPSAATRVALDARAAERLGHAPVPGGARRSPSSGIARCSAARDGRALLALHVAHQHRSRDSRRCRSRTRRTTPTYLAKRHRPVRHARPGRGHLGAQRRRDRRRHLPAADLRHRRERAGHVLRRARPAARAARWSACSTPPIASSTCSGAISTPAHPAASRRRARAAPATRFAICIEHNDALVGRRAWRTLRARRRADGALGSRLQLVSARRQPERAGCTARAIWRCKPGSDGSRRVAARRGLVRDAGLLRRPQRACSSTCRAASSRASSRRAPRPAALKAEIIAQAQRPARRRARTRSASARRSTPRRSTAGPYVENAPDLLIGYNAGYRASWDGATGIVPGPVFDDNTKAWSGDHCIDPRLVPGVFFCNRPGRRRGRSGAHRHRAHRAPAVRHRAARLHGRAAAGPSAS